MADQSATLFGQALQDKMDEKGLDIRGLAEQAETTYEYVRKMLRGLALPSKYMLKVLCANLGMNEREMEKLLVADRIRMKYGKIPALLAGKNPELEPIERVWGSLSAGHKEDLIRMAQTWAKHDREAAATA